MRLLLVLLYAVLPGGATVLRAAHREALEKPTQKPRRIAWFNAPKTGNLFGSTVVHYANSSLPKWEPGAALREHFGKWMGKWETSLVGNLWMPGTDPHIKVSPRDFNAFKGFWAGMFRQPEQRVISAFLDKAHGNGDIKTYAKRMEGAVVKQLAGQEDGEAFACWPGVSSVPQADMQRHHLLQRCGAAGLNDTRRKPQKPNLDLALFRLRRGFNFVGLTSHYNLAVCLFHSMFGGECLPGEIAVLREPTNSRKSGLTSTKSTLPLNGYKDPYDGRLYQEAERMFWRLIAKHNVSEESCRISCPSGFGEGDVLRTIVTGW